MYRLLPPPLPPRSSRHCSWTTQCFSALHCSSPHFCRFLAANPVKESGSLVVPPWQLLWSTQSGTANCPKTSPRHSYFDSITNKRLTVLSRIKKISAILDGFSTPKYAWYQTRCFFVFKWISIQLFEAITPESQWIVESSILLVSSSWHHRLIPQNPSETHKREIALRLASAKEELGFCLHRVRHSKGRWWLDLEG